MRQTAFIVTVVIGIFLSRNHCACVTLCYWMPPLPPSSFPVCTLLYSGITVTWRHSNMVDERGLNVNKARHHEVERISLIYNPEKLRIHLLNRTEPIVFDGAARQWTCSQWTPEFFATEVGDLRTRFRFCSRANSPANETPYKKAIMETDCEFEEASFGEFFQWLNGSIERSGSLSRFQR